jgi:hypothetical protein
MTGGSSIEATVTELAELYAATIYRRDTEGTQCC